MPILSTRLKKCAWLNGCQDMLFKELDCIESWILGHRKKPNPCLEKMLLAFERLSKTPDLVIVGQDPYPDDRATGIAFQTKGNVHSSSLDTFSLGLGICSGCYPNIARWVDKYGILMANAALCNFGECGNDKIFDRWHKFIVGILEVICNQNPNVVVMLIGKERVWKLLNEGNVVKCKHPAHGWGPSHKDWHQVLEILTRNGICIDLTEDSVEVVRDSV